MRKMINKTDIKIIMDQIESDWLETTISMSKEEYAGTGFTVHFYMKGKETSEEICFYGEMKYQLHESCIAFLEDDTNTYFAYSAIEQIYVDKTG